MSKKTRLTQEQKTEIVRLRKEGLTQSAIAAKMGISQGGVSNVLKEPKKTDLGSVVAALQDIEDRFPGTIESIQRGEIRIARRVEIKEMGS